jgi:hypothetical protein
MSTNLSPRIARRATIAQLAYPVARPIAGSRAVNRRALPAAIFTVMSACATFAVVITNLPHGY